MRQFTTRTVGGNLASVYIHRTNASLSGWVYEPKGRLRQAVNWDEDGEADTSFFDSISPRPNMRPMNERWNKLTAIQRELILLEPNHAMFDEMIECEAENAWNRNIAWFCIIVMCLMFYGTIWGILS